MKRYRLAVLALAVFAAALLLAACNNDDVTSLPEAKTLGSLLGIQSGIAESSVLSKGWTLCYSDTYADGTTPVSSILSACGGAHLMLACRPVGDANLTLASHAPRSVVTADTGNADNGVYTPFGSVGWYFNDNWSWGFFVAGDGVGKNSCDVASGAYPDQRMCWHASGGFISDGYRCGTNILNLDPTWERLVYTFG